MARTGLEPCRTKERVVRGIVWMDSTSQSIYELRYGLFLLILAARSMGANLIGYFLEKKIMRFRFRDNASANEVARELATLHGVDVPADTIYAWNRQLSEDFASAMTSPAPVATTGEEAGQASSTPDPASSGEASDGKPGSGQGGITTISVDGTFVTTGVRICIPKLRSRLVY